MVKIRNFLWKYMPIEEQKKFYFNILVWLMSSDTHSYKMLLEIIEETQISHDNLALSLYDSIDNDFFNEKAQKWKELTHYVYVKYGQLDNIVTTDVEIKFGNVHSITKFLLEKNEIINKLEHGKFNKFINTGKMG